MQKSAMRRFANIYILLFLIDAGLSLIDELSIAEALPVPVFSELRHFVAFLVLCLSMVLFICLGIDQRLPKRVLLPLTLYTFWASLAMWPLSGVIERTSISLFAAGNQLVLGGIVMLFLRRLGGQKLLSRERFQAPLFSWRNTLVFSAFNLLLLPVVLIYSGLAITSYYLEQQTAGFLRLSPVGIFMSERSYRHQGKQVRLAGMMHIGQEEYYKELATSMSTGQTIILAEGVTDHDKLLEYQFNYSKLAGVIGLSSQEKMQINARLVDLDHLDTEDRNNGEAGMPDIAIADIDLSQFDPQTIEFLNQLGRTLLGDKPLLEGLAEYNIWVNQQMTPERIAGVMTDILDKRNAVVIEGLLRTLPRYDTVIVPWGAMHMPAIEAAVLEQGFAPVTVRERLSVDFREIPYAALWREWSTRQR